MTEHLLTPGFVRFTYQDGTFPHKATLPVTYDGVPTPGVDPHFLTQDATSVLFSAEIALYITQFKKVFHNTCTFGLAEAFYWPGADAPPQFIFALDIGEVGGSISPADKVTEGIISLRTLGGNVLRIYQMGMNLAPNLRFNSLSGAPTPIQDIVDFLLDDTQNFVVGRDNSFPVAFLSYFTKTNDKLRAQQGF